jgi:hypothetical protein
MKKPPAPPAPIDALPPLFPVGTPARMKFSPGIKGRIIAWQWNVEKGTWIGSLHLEEETLYVPQTELEAITEIALQVFYRDKVIRRNAYWLLTGKQE